MLWSLRSILPFKHKLMLLLLFKIFDELFFMILNWCKREIYCLRHVCVCYFNWLKVFFTHTLWSNNLSTKCFQICFYCFGCMLRSKWWYLMSDFFFSQRFIKGFEKIFYCMIYNYSWNLWRLVLCQFLFIASWWMHLF